MKSSFFVAIRDAPLLKENVLISLECFRKICLKEQKRSGTVTSLFKKFQITGPLYCKVFLPVSELNMLLSLVLQMQQTSLIYTCTCNKGK